jgi:TonB-dependent receptor
MNFEIPYSLGTHQDGFIKFGGKARTKDKERDKQSREFSGFYEHLQYYSQTAPSLGLTTVVDDFYEGNLLNHGYVLEQIPHPGEIRDFFEAHPQHFRYDEQGTWEETYQEDYKARENIYAGYLMFQHYISRLMILGGLRFEQTHIDYSTQLAWLELEVDSLRGLLLKDMTSDKRTMNFWLPQMQIKFSVNQHTNLRAALTYTYSRPNFDDILPYRIEDEDGNIEKGNPALEYPVSLNIDLLAETFLKNNGILSGGLFYKKIDNIVFQYVRRAHEGENFNRYGLKEITMPVNGIKAFVYGAEIQAQYKFSTLPGILKHFGIYGTYTFTESDAYISKRYPQNEKDMIYVFDDFESDFFTNSDETEVIPLPGQAKHTINAALFYETDRMYTKLSANYHSEFLDELGNDSGLDVYYEKSVHVDFTANYQLNDFVNIFVDLVNLTNAPLRYYMGTRDYFKQQEFYSWTIRAGLKFEF